MRLLHTSDWHFGRSIRGRSRMSEFEAFSQELVAIAKDQQVDAVLIAGDLFDSPVPAAEYEQLLYQTLLQLRALGTQVVAINGNHESEQRLDAVAPLLDGNQITMVTGLKPPRQGGIVTVASRQGDQTAEIACIPFIPARKVADGKALFERSDSWPAAYAEQTAAIVNGFVAQMSKDCVRVVMAHLFASGAKMGGGEREVSVGPDYAVPASALPSDVAYIALGHIHKSQRVTAAASPTWYSGSPLMLDFGEERDVKSVSIVDVSPRKPASVEQIELTAGRKLVTLSGSLEEVLTAGGKQPDAYLRLRIELPAPLPGLADEVRNRLANVVDVQVSYPASPDSERPVLENLAPRQLFGTYLQERRGFTDVDQMLDTFDELLQQETGGVL
jgi:DNA repair protein SbcD/Mre11